MYCPFCKQDLHDQGIQISRGQYKVVFECLNGECEKGEDKVFFVYLNQSDLEY
jgi:hypothetical protein